MKVWSYCTTQQDPEDATDAMAAKIPGVWGTPLEAMGAADTVNGSPMAWQDALTTPRFDAAASEDGPWYSVYQIEIPVAIRRRPRRIRRSPK